MAYLDSHRRASPGSLAAVVAIHAGIGIALVAGLTVTGTITPRVLPTPTFDFPDPLPPPPPQLPEPQPSAATKPTTDLKVVAPETPIDLSDDPLLFDSTTIIAPRLPEAMPTFSETPMPRATPPRVKPVAATPSNDPARWVSDRDYRSEWSRREWSGKASFRLQIAADGHVERCTITASSGHEALDQATCALISRRARFEPARDGNGEAVAGSYANSITWRLPD